MQIDNFKYWLSYQLSKLHKSNIFFSICYLAFMSILKIDSIFFETCSYKSILISLYVQNSGIKQSCPSIGSFGIIYYL